MDNMQWWRDARFGMFIHWGLYSVPAGEYQGKPAPGIAEWIMRTLQIPVAEYAKFADEFDASQFNAEEWVKLAYDAGMKYLCITSKHHDGFAMFDSACDDYNIVKRTPFARDPMKELADACHKYGIKLCFYYSQAQDWAHKDGIGNNWDYPPEEEKDFDNYMNEKVLPQLTEILTNYGEIGIIWFDTPMHITEQQSLTICNHVKKLQPNCMVSGRIGHGFSDYKSSGDNTIPRHPVNVDWECPATLNDTWGFKTNDHNWKKSSDLIKLMVDINSKGGNYLLNVGPDKHGHIPDESQRILREVGEWMKVNGDSIYGTVPGPETVYETPGIMFTHKPGKLFLHVFENPEDETMFWKGILLWNLGIKFKRVYFMNEPDVDLSAYCVNFDDGAHFSVIPMDDSFKPTGRSLYSRLDAGRPTKPMKELFPEGTDTVICIEYEDEIVVDPF